MLTDPKEDYARGYVPFLDCKIFLDSKPLIPRVETEYWVEQAITEIKKDSAGKQIKALDLFAGSGAIGIAILKYVPESHMDFGEIERAHFPTILKSIRANAIDEERVEVIETDVYSEITGTYDFIFANPPYLSKKNQGEIESSVLVHEPHRALFADEDGFALIRKTIASAQTYLLPGGTLYIEHDPEQSDLLLSLAKEEGLRGENRTDQFGRVRYSVLHRQ